MPLNEVHEGTVLKEPEPCPLRTIVEQRTHSLGRVYSVEVEPLPDPLYLVGGLDVHDHLERACNDCFLVTRGDLFEVLQRIGKRFYLHHGLQEAPF